MEINQGTNAIPAFAFYGLGIAELHVFESIAPIYTWNQVQTSGNPEKIENYIFSGEKYK